MEVVKEKGKVGNQTLSLDRLNLTEEKIISIITFMNSLTDNPFQSDQPNTLPKFEDKAIDNRKIGGTY